MTSLSFLPPNFCKRLPLAKPKQRPTRREPRDALSRATSLEVVLGAEHRRGRSAHLQVRLSSLLCDVCPPDQAGPTTWDSVRLLEGVGGRERPAGHQAIPQTCITP